MSNKHVVLVGAGVMSSTLAMLIKRLEPGWDITILEREDAAAEESSNVWNNAGTGHEALCELNYTPEGEDGTIHTDKALEIYNQFQVSKQFWSDLIKNGYMSTPEDFIRPLPHISFVQGQKNIDFLSKRYNKISKLPAFENMEYTEDAKTIQRWSPLIMKGREKGAFASTKMDGGTDVNFGKLTVKMMEFMQKDDSVNVLYNSEVTSVRQNKQKQWDVCVRNRAEGWIAEYTADFLFIGAGGNAIPLLQKSKIRQSKHIGGFPISGQFLYCDKPDVVREHHAKAYGKEPEGKPPMTVPHLDKRHVDGKEVLLFGPFAAFGPKFLKKGSNMDFFKHLKWNNVLTMAAAGLKNIPLIQYSIDQVLMSKEDKIEELRRFVPSAELEDWDVIVAGKRVQIIKDLSKRERGVIHFGTEVVNSDDHTLSALLGESPGASTSVSIMIQVLKENFPDRFESWEKDIKKMIPSYGVDLNEDREMLQHVKDETNDYLKLT
ncbi:MAG TPA: malate dehydrogenase (quinone) [Virgibacillus sp.]|nr:malate dehydrogenase (quinone) [Virgibacillus sp.]